MRPTVTRSLQAAAALLLAESVSGQAITSYNPCPQDPTVTSVTVTAQYQPVSTCYPTSTCFGNGTCVPTFGYSTSKFVSTVIPCAVSGTSTSSCTVTSVQDTVVLSTVTTTFTDVHPVFTGGPRRGRPRPSPSYTTIYDARDRKVEAEYDLIGPIGIPGYGGSNLCETCVLSDGTIEQPVNITECRKRSDQALPDCRQKSETWVQLPAPAPIPTSAVCATRYQAPSAGVYTFSFKQMAPAKTITQAPATVTKYLGHGHHTQHIRPGRIYTITEHPWWAVVTRSCNGPTIIDVTTTVTTTLTVTAPVITVTT